MSKDQPGNQTPDTPGVSETELRNTKVDDLRDRARKAGVDGAAQMNKDDLVQAIVKAERPSATSEDTANAQRGDEGVRLGEHTSKSVRYSQEITSPQDEPEREGRSLVTTNHAVIKQWAEERNAVPATVANTRHDDHLGVLRLDFGGDSDTLQHVSWEEWLKTFEERRLNFIYQDKRSDGTVSNFFRLESPDREDA